MSADDGGNDADGTHDAKDLAPETNRTDRSSSHRSGDDLLVVDDVVKTFGGLVAIDGVSFGVADGSITGLIGPNGAGKSTLFDCVTGVYRPDRGTVTLDGEPIQGLSPHEVAGRGVGRTFQTPKTFRGMSVRENLAFAATEQTGETALGALFRGRAVREEERAVQERVDETLAFLELEYLADEYASGLSGGQRKLLELGRVLMMEPEIILLDEPAAGVNPALTDQLFDRLLALNDRGRTILFIEHDMDLVMAYSDRVVVMHNGKTLAVGPPDIVQEDERVVEAYLGGYD